MKLERINDKNGNALGSIEYEPGYGVHARRSNSERATFLTNGYRAAIGAIEVDNVSRAKAMARRWVKEGCHA